MAGTFTVNEIPLEDYLEDQTTKEAVTGDFTVIIKDNIIYLSPFTTPEPITNVDESESAFVSGQFAYEDTNSLLKAFGYSDGIRVNYTFKQLVVITKVAQLDSGNVTSEAILSITKNGTVIGNSMTLNSITEVSQTIDIDLTATDIIDFNVIKATGVDPNLDTSGLSVYLIFKV